MELAFLNHNRFVAQFNGNYLAQFHYLRPRSLLQICRNRLFFQLSIRSIRQHLREVFDLIIRQAHATVRRERAYLRQRFPAMNQISAADGNFDWPERVTCGAGGDNCARVGSPRFVRLRPGGVKDDHFRFAETGRQGKLLIADADFVRFQKRPVAKYVHAESRNVDDNARVRGHRVWTLQLG